MALGAKSDLLSLARVTIVKSRTARIFWENGYKSVGAVAAASLDDLMPILSSVTVLQSFRRC
jgi:hypothetical protein